MPVCAACAFGQDDRLFAVAVMFCHPVAVICVVFIGDSVCLSKNIPWQLRLVGIIHEYYSVGGVPVNPDCLFRFISRFYLETDYCGIVSHNENGKHCGCCCLCLFRNRQQRDGSPEQCYQSECLGKPSGPSSVLAEQHEAGGEYCGCREYKPWRADKRRCLLPSSGECDNSSRKQNQHISCRQEQHLCRMLGLKHEADS